MSSPEIAAPEVSPSRLSRLAPVIGLALFVLSLFVLHDVFRAVRFADVLHHLEQLPVSSLLLGLLFTAAAYLFIALYDPLALRYTGSKMPLRQTAYASATSYAIANSIGFAIFSANVVRVNLYSRWGAGAQIISVVAVVAELGILAGAIGASAIGLIAAHGSVIPWLSGNGGLAAGLIVLVSLLAGIIYVGGLKGERRVLGTVVHIPGRWTLAFQLVSAVFDWLLTAAVLWILLPHGVRPEFLAFVPVFIISGLIGGATGLPGGIGAFDAAILLLMPTGSEAGVAAALVGYRALYFLVPLIAAAVSFVWIGRASIGRTGKTVSDRYTGAVLALAPTLLSAVSFVAGVLVLLSAATPALPASLARLETLVPSRLIDASHFLSSLAGVLLILASFGLRKRVKAAWAMSVVLLAFTAILALLSGSGFTTAGMLAIIGCLIFASRKAFYRVGGLAEIRLDTGAIAALLGVVALFIWVGLNAYRTIDFQTDMVWSFALQGDAPRFVRAAFVVLLVSALALVSRAFQPSRPEARPGLIDSAKLDNAITNARTGHADANLAWLGDKHLFFSPSGQTFLQYGIRSRRYVVMGEPCGDPAEVNALLWAFREHADKRGAVVVFYSVGERLLPDLVDLGLSIQKVGEAAHIPLASFSLEGPARASLRQARNRAGREGASFRIVPVEEVPALLPDLKRISDEWLTMHAGSEKAFSLGRFDPAYLSRFPMAVVDANGKAAAFANIWQTADKRELSIDLMRYGEGAPHGVMDYLFTELALWGSVNGYGLLDLGMAPLSGLEGRRLAPVMTRLGDFIYDNANALYGFQGLRDYKAKFKPEWVPLYIAAPGRALVALALSDVALLTSGGIIGMLRHGD